MKPNAVAGFFASWRLSANPALSTFSTNLRDKVNAYIFRINLAISTAAMAASYPLLPALPPAR